jgi:hypothetical protein
MVYIFLLLTSISDIWPAASDRLTAEEDLAGTSQKPTIEHVWPIFTLTLCRGCVPV